MGWGDSFSAAWEKATDAAKTAAAAVASGAVSVGRRVLDGSKWVASQTVAAATWMGMETARVARWSAHKAAEGATWVKQEGVAGVRGIMKGVGSPGFGLLGRFDETKQSMADKVNTALDKVRERFGQHKPEQPTVKCPLLDPAKDVNLDGTLISYPDGKCAPVTAKSEAGPDQIAKAEANAYQSDSPCCQARRAKGEPPRTIVYVNGVQTTKEKHCETLKAIGDLTCAKVYGVYNATAGLNTSGFYRDAVQTSQDRRLIFEANKGRLPQAHDGRNPAVDSLSDLIVTQRKDGKPLELWAHSQGGAITSLALYDAANTLAAVGKSDALKGVQVKSFGSAAPHWPDDPTYEHYVQVNDATPVLFGLGDDSASDHQRAGVNAKMIRFSGKPSDGQFKTEQLDESIPASTSNHDITATYLKMEKQEHGGCP